MPRPPLLPPLSSDSVVALVLPHSIFFHVGRTAGHCVRKTIREMEIPAYDVGSFHDWPSNIQLNDTE